MPPTSSPLSSPPASQPLSKIASVNTQLRQYRAARELPFELAQHVHTYYEETLFTQAYGFLFSITANSASSSTPVFVPPTSHLALAATLTVHPVLTTRTTSREKKEQANSALKLLRLLHKTVGPINSGFYNAFSFKRYDFETSTVDDSDPNYLNTPYASNESIWHRAEDFWQVVGWAFNCACLPDMYAARWEHWHLWLSFMLDVLETDWQLHHDAGTSEESLLWQYVELSAGGHARARRILRAIFADGSTKSLNEFREVFRNELKPPAQPADQPKKREVNVNVDTEEYGDYLAASESDDSPDDDITLRPNKRVRTRHPSLRRATPRSSTSSLRSTYSAAASDSFPISSSSTTLGGPTVLSIRLRLCHLLSHISAHPTLTSTSPTTFPDLPDLYTLFVEFLKPLPLTAFAAFALPTALTNSSLSPDAHATLAEYLLQRLLEASAPTVRAERFLTTRKLEREYLPFAAGRVGADANARVSLLLEALVRRLDAAGALSNARDALNDGSDALKAALEQGIRRREERGRMGDGRKKRKKKTTKGKGDMGDGYDEGEEKDEEEEQETEAYRWLVESGERMRRVVEG